MDKKTILKLLILFLTCFLFIAINLNNKIILDGDIFVSSLVISHQNNVWNSVCSNIGIIFEPIYVVILILIISIFFWTKKLKKEALFMVFVSSVSGALIFLFKILFVRARPTLQFLQETGYSFPSGHATISIILFGSLIYFSFREGLQKSRVFFILLYCFGVFILGLSRIYLNVHWFSDVLGGYFLGAIILFTGIYLYKINIFQRAVILFCPK